MQHKILNLFIVLVLLSGSAGTVSLRAEVGDPPDREPGGASPPEIDLDQTGRIHPMRLAAGDAAAPEITLGEPGLSFSYRGRFGVSESPYLADTQHLNDAHGIFIDAGNDVYIAEGEGARLLRYESNGTNSLAVGRVGMNYNGEDNFAFPRDVDMDAGGNIWVVDDSRAVQFDVGGNFLQQFPEEDDGCTPDNNTFCGPYGIAFDSTGRMFIADTENHRVQVFTFVAGAPVYQDTIGESFVPDNDAQHFDWPARVAVDSLDRVYVVDTNNHRVQRCVEAMGWTCTTFHGTGFEGDGDNQLAWPMGISIHGSDVFIVDSDNFRVKKCDLAGSCSPNFIPDLAYPLDAAVDSSGAVYVVENSTSYTVGKFDAAGNFISVFAGVHRVPYLTDTTRINSPGGVGLDRNGNVYIPEQRGHRLLKISPAGARLWTIGEAGISGRDNTHFGHLRGSVAVDAAGRVYVTDYNRHRVQIYNANSTFFGSIPAAPDFNPDCDSTHFNYPSGVAISPLNGDIFVVDRENNRIQVFTSARVYKGTLGDPFCSPGADNAHLDWPHGVAVDRLGNIYVADRGNHRVQKFNSSLVRVMTFGQTGVANDNYGVVGDPVGVAVDAAGRVFVLENWSRRVQVFDAAGAFLTAFGQSWGAGTAQMRAPTGIAVDAFGCVYVAERDNHRVQKFCPGTPRWVQRNLNGFGDRNNYEVISLGTFGGMLYAGTSNESGTGAQLYRSPDGRNWSPVFTNGLGDSANIAIEALREFGGKLYLGTANYNPDFTTSNGAQVWRSGDGAVWEEVTPAGLDANDPEVAAFETFGTHLYLGTWAINETEGGEIWRTSDGSTDWTKVVDNGNLSVNNGGVTTFAVHNGRLYAGTYNSAGAEVWASADGATWGPPVASGGFGDEYNLYISSMKSFGSWLYVGANNFNLSDNPGAELWRCQVCTGSDWEMVAKTPNPNNRANFSMIVYHDQLYVATFNTTTGSVVWRTSDGVHWEKVSEDGFGNAANRRPYYNNNAVVFDDYLFIGMYNFQNGGSIWMYLPWQMYLPMIARP